MAVPKPILTEFGIHYRLESCALLFTCSCTNLPHIPAKTYSEHLFVNPRGKPLFQGKMILVLSGKAFILCERRIVEGDILPQHFVSPKGTFLNSKYPPWNYNLDVWVNWLWNIRRVIFLPALLIESIRLLPQIPWSLMVLFFSREISPCVLHSKPHLHKLAPIKVFSEMIKWKRIIWYICSFLLLRRSCIAWARGNNKRYITKRNTL